MKKIIAFLVSFAFAASSQDIVLSKDSLRVIDNFHPSRSGDSLTIVNNGPQPILLDSARLLITEIDTAGSFFRIAGAGMMMNERHHGTRASDFFTVRQDTAAGYCLDFSMSSKSFISVGPSGDSIIIGNIQIVDCFFCDAPDFPRYIRGNVRFHFNNGETAEIRVYSDDLRPAVKKRVAAIRRCISCRSGNRTHYLIDGRKIPGELIDVNRQRVRHRTYEMERNK